MVLQNINNKLKKDSEKKAIIVVLKGAAKKLASINLDSRKYTIAGVLSDYIVGFYADLYSEDGEMIAASIDIINRKGK